MHIQQQQQRKGHFPAISWPCQIQHRFGACSSSYPVRSGAQPQPPWPSTCSLTRSRWKHLPQQRQIHTATLPAANAPSAPDSCLSGQACREMATPIRGPQHPVSPRRDTNKSPSGTHCPPHSLTTQKTQLMAIHMWQHMMPACRRCKCMQARGVETEHIWHHEHALTHARKRPTP